MENKLLQGVFDQVKKTGLALGMDKTKIYQTAAALYNQAKNPQPATVLPSVKTTTELGKVPNQSGGGSWGGGTSGTTGGGTATTGGSSAGATGGGANVDVTVNVPTPTPTPSIPTINSTATPLPTMDRTSSFNDVWANFNANYSKLRDNAGYPLYKTQVEDAYASLKELKLNPDKYVSSKKFAEAINRLNNAKFMVRPNLIEMYKAQGLDAVDIEKLIGNEVTMLDDEIGMLESKWRDQLTEYKSKIDSAKDDISLATTNLKFALDDVSNGVASFQDAATMFNNLQSQNNTWIQQQTQLAETIANLKADGVDTSFLEGQLDTAMNPKSVINLAKPFMNTKYVWGGTTPAGTDCSGLTQSITKEKYGVTLPRTAAGQYNSDLLMSVPFDSVQPGDLIYFSDPTDFRITDKTLAPNTPTHCGIVTENGTVLHSSPSNPNGGVMESYIDELMTRWKSATIVGVKRVKEDNSDTMYTLAPPASFFKQRQSENHTEQSVRLKSWFFTASMESTANPELYKTFDKSKAVLDIASALNQSPYEVKTDLEATIQYLEDTMIAKYDEQKALFNGDDAETIFDMWKNLGGFFTIEQVVEDVDPLGFNSSVLNKIKTQHPEYFSDTSEPIASADNSWIDMIVPKANASPRIPTQEELQKATPEQIKQVQAIVGQLVSPFKEMLQKALDMLLKSSPPTKKKPVIDYEKGTVDGVKHSSGYIEYINSGLDPKITPNPYKW